MKRNIFAVLIAMAAMVIFAGCEKEINFNPGQDNDGDIINRVELNYSVHGPEKSAVEKNAIVSGAEISGSVNYYFSFWLTPATGDPIALGIFEIRNEDDVIVYISATAENGIDHKFSEPGMYTLLVNGNLGGTSFNFNNIEINVLESGVIPDDPDEIPATSPVRLHNFHIDGNTAYVNVVISKSEYQAQSSASWFHVKRVNGTDWSTNNAVISEEDSVRFTLSFPATNQTYVEFNAAFHDGSTGGMWLTPSAGQTPSILYSGATNTPYNNSGSFFGMRLNINGSAAELRTYAGILLLSTEDEIEIAIPGNNGDGPSNDYTVRWSGYTHFFKTEVTNPTFRYKIGSTGTYEFLTATVCPTNSEYFQVEIPAGTTGEMRFQFGTGTGSSFVPSLIEMSHSMYYEGTTLELVKNI